MSARPVAIAAAAAVMAAAFFGCTSVATPDVQSWLLRGAPPADRAPGNDAGSLQIAAVQVAGHIDGIVILRPDGRADTLVYQRWAAPVGEMVATAVKAYLDAAPFEFVLLPTSPGAADHILRLHVRRLEIEERPGAEPAAVVDLEATLLKPPGREVCWAGRAQGSQPCKSPQVPDLVAALDKALGQALTALAAEIVPVAQRHRQGS